MTKKMSLNEFIEGANKDKKIVKARRRTSSEKIKLSVSGKVNDRVQYKKYLLYVCPELDEKIYTHCVGSKQGVLTFLIKTGLEELLKREKITFYEVD